MEHRVRTTCFLSLGLLLATIPSLAQASSYPAQLVLPQADSFTVSDFLGEPQGESAGRTVSHAGDVNGDGIDDYLVADPTWKSRRGRAYVVFGRPGRLPAVNDLGSLDGNDGFAIEGLELNDHVGTSLAGIGDVDGDGVDDVAVGALYGGVGTETSPGECYVIYGQSTTPFPASIRVDGLDGTNGFTVRGKTAQDRCSSVARAGDVNHDGIDDWLVATSVASPQGRQYAGECYVLFGSRDGIPARVDVAALDGTNGFTIPGLNRFDALGTAIAGAGDINDDGIDDILLVAKTSGSARHGTAYVIFGRSGGFGPTFDLSSLDGTNGFVIEARDGIDWIPGPVSGAADWNHDGVDDMIVAALFGGVERRDTRGAYVIFGTSAGFPASFDVSQLDGTNGFVLRTAYDDRPLEVHAIASAGDVDDDGIDDLVLGGEDLGVFGAVLTVFGRNGGFEAEVRTDALDGSNGFVLLPREQNIRFGSAAALADVNDDGAADLVLGAVGAQGLGDPRSGEAYVFYGRPDCRAGKVNAANGIVLNSLFVNGSTGGSDRTLDLTTGDFVDVTVLLPLAGGSGRFVVHADEGDPAATLASPLPLDIGATCFPFLLTEGGRPVIVANNLGRANAVGSSNFYGFPQADPSRATTTFSYPPLPFGLVLTFQGVLADPGSISSKRASTTNAITVRIVD